MKKQWYGLSVRASNVLENGDMVRPTEAETREVVKGKIESGEIRKHRNCGKLTISEFEAWLETPCGETEKARCVNCRFMEKIEDDSETGFEAGLCHRFPPAHVSAEYVGLMAWGSARVYPDEGWCGEWRRK
jgi:hypothetical protein